MYQVDQHTNKKWLVYDGEKYYIPRQGKTTVTDNGDRAGVFKTKEDAEAFAKDLKKRTWG